MDFFAIRISASRSNTHSQNRPLRRIDHKDRSSLAITDQ